MMRTREEMGAARKPTASTSNFGEWGKEVGSVGGTSYIPSHILRSLFAFLYPLCCGCGRFPSDVGTLRL